MRVRVGQRPFQTVTPEKDHEPVAFARFDDDLGVADFFDFLREHQAKVFADSGVNAAGPAVGDDAFGVKRAEVGAGGHVARAEVQAQPERLDDATAYLELERIIAEQGQVARPAAGRDAGRDGKDPALGRVLAERVQVGSAGRFERRKIALVARGQVAQSIQDHQRQFGLGLERQFGVEAVEVH